MPNDLPEIKRVYGASNMIIAMVEKLARKGYSPLEIYSASRLVTMLQRFSLLEEELLPEEEAIEIDAILDTLFEDFRRSKG